MRLFLGTPPQANRIGTLLSLLLLAVLLSCSPGMDTGEGVASSSLSVSDLLGGVPQEGYARALEPRPFRFPDDHGPHPDYRTEWWYLTGNLAGPDGEAFGFQLTFFRSALSPEKPDLDGSSWRSNQAYMAHFALTVEEGRRFRSFERFGRSALGLAGAEAAPFRVWLEDWELAQAVDGKGDSIFPLSLHAVEGGISLTLSLDTAKPRVLQGDRGLSKKGTEPGNASYYYSFTRLEASGTLTLDGVRLAVEGFAWLDREWSTSALGPGLVGWDWFALQFDDGYDLMFYQLRGADGGPDSHSGGIWVNPDGSTRRIAAQEVEIEVRSEWESPLDGARYPASWRVSVPALDLALQVTPLIPNQEMALTFRYWEGAVRVEGTRGDSTVVGSGYVELTGYSAEKGTDSRDRRIGRTGNR